MKKLAIMFFLIAGAQVPALTCAVNLRSCFDCSSSTQNWTPIGGGSFQCYGGGGTKQNALQGVTCSPYKSGLSLFGMNGVINDAVATGGISAAQCAAHFIHHVAPFCGNFKYVNLNSWASVSDPYGAVQSMDRKFTCGGFPPNNPILFSGAFITQLGSCPNNPGYSYAPTPEYCAKCLYQLGYR